MVDLPQLPARGSSNLPSVMDAVTQALGLDPSIQRGEIMPFGRDASGEMVVAWPQAAIDAIKAVMLPGHVVQGGAFTLPDVTEMVLNVGGMSSLVPGPAGAKRMFGGINGDNVPKMSVGLPKAEAAAYLARRTGVSPVDANRWLDRMQPDPRNPDGSFDIERIGAMLARVKEGATSDSPGVIKGNFGNSGGPSLESLVDGTAPNMRIIRGSR